MTKRCGYIALVGAPNAGKSTLLNALLKKKISIVSNKPQTTRTRVLGILLRDQAQMIFLDTPGLGNQAKGLAQSVWDACADADVICYLIDITKGWRPEDSVSLQKLATAYSKPLLILGTKTDKVKKRDLLEINNKFQEKIKDLELSYSSLIMLSAKKSEDLNDFSNLLSKNIPKAEWLYDSEMVTDTPQTLMCAEFVREQIFRQLGDELPYQAAVEIEHFLQKPHIIEIHAIIKVARESQKAIFIGHGGIKLKSIGQMARETMEQYLNKKVFLKIFVKKGEV